MIAWGFENALSFKLESTTRALTLRTFNDTWGKKQLRLETPLIAGAF